MKFTQQEAETLKLLGDTLLGITSDRDLIITVVELATDLAGWRSVIDFVQQNWNSITIKDVVIFAVDIRAQRHPEEY